MSSNAATGNVQQRSTRLPTSLGLPHCCFLYRRRRWCRHGRCCRYCTRGFFGCRTRRPLTLLRNSAEQRVSSFSLLIPGHPPSPRRPLAPPPSLPIPSCGTRLRTFAAAPSPTFPGEQARWRLVVIVKVLERSLFCRFVVEGRYSVKFTPRAFHPLPLPDPALLFRTLMLPELSAASSPPLPPTMLCDPTVPPYHPRPPAPRGSCATVARMPLNGVKLNISRKISLGLLSPSELVESEPAFLPDLVALLSEAVSPSSSSSGDRPRDRSSAALVLNLCALLAKVNNVC